MLFTSNNAEFCIHSYSCCGNVPKGKTHKHTQAVSNSQLTGGNFYFV